MPSAANLRRISWDELPVLRDLYRVGWPRYAFTFYTLECCYSWRELARNGEVDVYIDPERDWRTTGTFVLRDCKELFFFTLETTFDSLERVLRTVMSSMDTSVSLVYDSCFRDLVDRTIAALSFAKSSDERMLCYRQLAPYEDAKHPHHELLDGFHFRGVKPEDSVLVEQRWQHNDPVFTNLPTRLIKRNPSLGVYDPHDHLVAWCLIDQTGALAIFQTIPDHRRKGIGRALIKEFSKQLHERTQLPQAYIVESNMASRRLFEQLGFTAVEQWFWTKVHKQMA
ncbi:uncharacterized protein LOC126565205 [Anopheles maculipalpis]|uniref:uncharacterized protein LOC126565205 n=1 Tax=Anopheles maculipalpis TaxID=1496333 RepID=UPI0021593F6D|nr:uncharacterized protein LOC126565205 [Anopheles maculipalpis]